MVIFSRQEQLAINGNRSGAGKEPEAFSGPAQPQALAARPARLLGADGWELDGSQPALPFPSTVLGMRSAGGMSQSRSPSPALRPLRHRRAGNFWSPSEMWNPRARMGRGGGVPEPGSGVCGADGGQRGQWGLQGLVGVSGAKCG